MLDEKQLHVYASNSQEAMTAMIRVMACLDMEVGVKWRGSIPGIKRSIMDSFWGDQMLLAVVDNDKEMRRLAEMKKQFPFLKIMFLLPSNVLGCLIPQKLHQSNYLGCFEDDPDEVALMLIEMMEKGVMQHAYVS